MSALHRARMERFADAGLYVVTSEALSAGRRTGDIVHAALEAGVRLVQLREKDMSLRSFVALAREMRELTARAGALLIINDRVDVALASEADGVHLGQEDFPIVDARRLGPDLIIGASSHDRQEAMEAQDQGASYVNIGPLFPTGTKRWDRQFLGVEAIARIGGGLKIPFTVMGGIKKTHLRELAEQGARTVAVVSAVTGAPDVAGAAREMLEELRRWLPPGDAPSPG